MYDESKGLIAIATGYSDGKYTYEKLNHDLLQQDTIQSTPDQMQDKDSYTNAKGYLRRTVMEHSRSKWEANTHIISDKELDQLLSLFDKGFAVNDGECSKKKRHLYWRSMARIRTIQYGLENAKRRTSFGLSAVCEYSVVREFDTAPKGKTAVLHLQICISKPRYLGSKKPR